MRRIWFAHETFRGAVATLLSMAPERFAILEELLGAGLDIDQEHIDASPLQADEAAPALAVLRTLYSFAYEDGEGLDTTLRELDELVRSDEEIRSTPGLLDVDRLRPLLVRREEYEQREHRSVVQHARSPVLEAVRLGLDIRLSTSANDERAVPVTWIEMVFDYPVGGGPVISADIPDEVVAGLRKQLDRLDTARARWEQSRGETPQQPE